MCLSLGEVSSFAEKFMYKKSIVSCFVLFIAIFFSGFNLAYANIVINEIMYAPSAGADYEWVEIYNEGNDPVDLTDWRFFHGETNSGPLTLRNGDTAVLPPSEYAIVAKSPSVVGDYSWLNFSGIIFSASTISLPDSGDNTYIAIASDTNKTISDSLTYDPSLGGSKESGNSLSKLDGSWSAGAPSPGAANQEAADSNNEEEENNEDSADDDNEENDNADDEEDEDATAGSSSPGGSSRRSSTSPAKKVENPKIKAKISAETFAFVGQPVEIKTDITGYSNEKIVLGRAYWNFGDGGFLEQVNNFEKFYHTYYYPGEYVVFLEYYSKSSSNVPDASSKITIKVVPMAVSISKVGDEKDFFVELSNDSNYEINISNWLLASSNKTFVLPKNTSILSKKKIIFSSRVTNFSTYDKNTLRLITPEGAMAFDYGASILVPVTTVAVKTASKSEPKKAPIVIPEKEIPVATAEATSEPVDNLFVSDNLNLGGPAAVIESGVAEENSISSYFLIITLIALLSVSAILVYFIRHKKIIPKAGDGFKILDE